MRRFLISCLCVFPLFLFVFSVRTDYERPQVLGSGLKPGWYLNLPLYFIKNDGQTDERVRYYENGFGKGIFFTDDGIYISMSGIDTGDGKRTEEYVKITPLDTSKESRIEAEEILEGRVNYFTGNDPSGWHRDIPVYAKLRYKEIYEKTDLVFYGNQGQLEYDIVVNPGADPGKVAFRYDGINDLRVNSRGELVAVLPSGREIIQRRPHIYQVKDGKKVELSGEYSFRKDGNSFVYGFAVPEYDRGYALVVDPVMLIASTYLGGTGEDFGSGIALDSEGNVYLTGNTSSVDFPLQNPLQSERYSVDVFVTKMNPSLSSLIYSTYIGGSNPDVGAKVVVDNLGNAYVTGYTDSSDFPLKDAGQNAFGGSRDAFMLKLGPLGNELLYSTYIGGLGYDQGYGIAVDSLGNTYVCGFTMSDTLPGQLDIFKGGTSDAFVAKVNKEGIVTSGFIGGSASESAEAIAFGKDGYLYIAGSTNSGDFQVSSDALLKSAKGIENGFLMKINPSVLSMVYSTYISGSDCGAVEQEFVSGVAVDSSGLVYLTGHSSCNDLPLKNAYQAAVSGSDDIYIIKLDLSKSGEDAVLYASFIGGSGIERGRAIAVDDLGNAFIAGYADSMDFPVKNAFQTKKKGFDEVVVVKMDTTKSGEESLVYSTYLGGEASERGHGIAIDSAGNAYLTGHTGSPNFPTTSDTFMPKYKGSYKVFISKLGVSYTLKVSLPGTGKGSVRSSPAGIDCGSDCEEIYASGTKVEMTATPDGDSVFMGWGDDCLSCAGNAVCSISVTSDRNCSAKFDIKQVEADAGEDIIDIPDVSQDTGTEDITDVTESTDISDTAEVSDITDLSEPQDIKDIIQTEDITDISADVSVTDAGQDTAQKNDGSTNVTEDKSKGDESGCSCSLIE